MKKKKKKKKVITFKNVKMCCCTINLVLSKPCASLFAALN